jgi:signal transduction histidine kinase
MVLLNRLGGRIDAILRENYDSVIAMERLTEALERIDSSFQFALAGRSKKAEEQYQKNWGPYLKNLEVEQKNITLPGEQELVNDLIELTEKYRKKGGAFYKLSAGDPQREQAYFGSGGLLDTFSEIKDVTGRILRLNQENMEDASAEARATARTSQMWFGIGVVVAVLVAGRLAWHTIRTILRPLQSMTHAAQGISAGNLDQLVPYQEADELGQLAQSFNTMTRHLRAYRKSQLAQLLRAQKTSQATIDSFLGPVLVLDAEGRVELANPAARRVFGVAPDGQSRGIPWQPPESLRQPLTEALRGDRDYLPDGFGSTVVVDGEQARTYLPHIMTIRDPEGTTLGAAVLLQDVTRFRFLDQFKTNLVATVSHELKTPLTSLRLALHLVLEEAVGPLTAKQTELLIDARDNAERLLAIVENLLDLARLEQNPQHLNIRPEAPAELLRAAADAIRPRCEDKGLELTVEAPPGLPDVAGDTRQLLHALGNLLDNAVTCTERGGRITLSAQAESDAVVLTAADTGVGIPPEHQSRVFERFFRVPGQARDGGTGLGLAIVREIITAHGGSITCQSSPGVGTSFRIVLPLWSSEETGEPPGLSRRRE